MSKKKSTDDILEQFRKSIETYEQQAGKKPEELRISLATWREVKELPIERLMNAITYLPGGVKAVCIYGVVVITEFGYVIKNSKEDVDWLRN